MAFCYDDEQILLSNKCHKEMMAMDDQFLQMVVLASFGLLLILLIGIFLLGIVICVAEHANQLKIRRAVRLKERKTKCRHAKRSTSNTVPESSTETDITATSRDNPAIVKKAGKKKASAARVVQRFIVRQFSEEQISSNSEYEMQDDKDVTETLPSVRQSEQALTKLAGGGSSKVLKRPSSNEGQKRRIFPAQALWTRRLLVTRRRQTVRIVSICMFKIA
uniref:Uncharacterized protein n=1 Tax=Ditylenchus dipsaci TaxID=166011 RepID=A0A915CYU2_9BILA